MNDLIISDLDALKSACIENRQTIKELQQLLFGYQDFLLASLVSLESCNIQL